MSKPDIVLRAARIIGGPSVDHAIRGDVQKEAKLSAA
jgi:hypothetical protein